MKLLFLSRWFPYPPDNGSKIRVYNLLKYLAARHTVHLLSFTGEPVSEDQIAALRQICEHVEAVPYRPFQPGRLSALAGLLARLPRSVRDTHNAKMQARVAAAARQNPYTAVIASQVDMAAYALALPSIPKILEEIELSTLYEQIAAERHPLKRARRRLMWQKWVNYTAYLLTSFDGCTAVSEKERQRVAAAVQSQPHAPIRVIRNGVDLARHSGDFGAPQPDTLIFTGGLTYGANFDAAQWFLQEVFPLIQARRPQVKLAITGKLDGAPVDRLPRPPGVELTGYLDDIRPRIAQSWVSIVPLRIGGGTRLKILESLALGTPVVATHKGAEGLELTAGSDLLLADTPDELAQAILRLLTDANLRQQLSQSGRQAVAGRYDWPAIGADLCAFVEEVVTSVQATGRRRTHSDR
jgi:sugar transferase (PEP-CTERM/EpsH1 system associated)